MPDPVQKQHSVDDEVVMPEEDDVALNVAPGSAEATAIDSPLLSGDAATSGISETRGPISPRPLGLDAAVTDATFDIRFAMAQAEAEGAAKPEAEPTDDDQTADDDDAEPVPLVAKADADKGSGAEEAAELKPLGELKRYRIRREGDARVIVSGNAPNIRLRVERGLSVNAAGRKRYGPQTVFLDGVYTGAPFFDNEARHYSLDHHAGCVRAFTLATCEQAVVMLLQGLPLSSDTWNLYVNDPDLDSMLAAWILLNHVELLRDDRAFLRRVMPVIRLEGVIDAHGTERELLTGFSEEVHKEVRAQVDTLMEPERSLKSKGLWVSMDFVEYTENALKRIDQLLFPEDVLRELTETQESGRASLANGRIAILLESKSGIYEVEARLKERYATALGVIVLVTGPDRYTLRLVDAFLRKDLSAVYKALNRIDPKARAGGSKPNLWGGSGDIGGSPRASGTGLSGDQILGVLETVLGVQPPWYKKIWAFLTGIVKPAPKALPPPKK